MKKFLLASAFFVVSQVNASTGVKTTGYDVTSLLSDPASGVSVWGGQSIKFSAPFVNGMKVVFEDLMPGANWGHPGVLKLVDKAGQTVEQKQTQRPPEGFEDMPQLWGNNQEVNAPKFNLNTFGGKLKVKNPEKYYAVLINGHADRRHWNDYSFLFRVMTQIYGYNKENIYVADGTFKDRACDLDDDGQCDIKYGSRKAEIKALLDELKGKLQADDHLLLAVNDHGGSTGGEATIILQDGEMKVSEFKPYFNALKPNKILSLYEQCFSGGFVRPSSTSAHRVSAAAAKDTEYSWASMDLQFDEWIYWTIAGFARQTYDGKTVDVSLNRDGKVSLQQAFAVSVARDQRQESPVLESYNNSGGASQIGLDF